MRFGHLSSCEAAQVDTRTLADHAAKIIATITTTGIAERKAGSLLAGMDGRGKHGGNRRSSNIVKLEPLGITKIQSHRWQKIAAIPDETFSPRRRR